MLLNYYHFQKKRAKYISTEIVGMHAAQQVSIFVVNTSTENSNTIYKESISIAYTFEII